MDKEALRRQLEDMEAASERWRSERRRLNAEIDKLEAALAEAKSAAVRKRTSTPAESKQPGVDPAAFAKLHEAADAKLEKAEKEWQTERAKLQSQINRLEGAVADAIARAANPMRATQSVKEQFEVELVRVAKEKNELEQAFLRAKTEWEQEKLKLAGEMTKVRRAAQAMGRHVPKEDAPEVNPKVRDLENQLQESLAKWNAEREQLVAQIQKLDEAKRQWDTERRQLNDHAGQLQQAFMKAEAKIQSFEVAARSPSPSESKVEEVQREKEILQRQSQEARNAWDEERRRLEQQLKRVSDTQSRVSNEVVDQLRQQYDQRLQEAIHQKTHLAQELQSASLLLESERARLSAAQTGDGGGPNKDSITAEVARVERLLTEIVAVIDNPDTELSTVIRKNVEKAELDAYLRGILFSLRRTK